MTNPERILVTGASGFFGTNFCRWLGEHEPGVQVWRYDRQFGQDIRDPERLRRDLEGMDLVYHLAAQSHVTHSIQDPMSFFSVNVMGTVAVLEACREARIRCLVISSSEVYGSRQVPIICDLCHDHSWYPIDRGDENTAVISSSCLCGGIKSGDALKPMREDHPLRGHYPYAASKIGADRAAMAAFICYGQDVVIIRPFNAAGAFQAHEKVIPLWISQACNGEPLTILGDGYQRRDWTFIDDICDALWRCRLLEPGTVVNIANGKNCSMSDLANLVIEALRDLNVLWRGDPPVFHVTSDAARPGEVFDLKGDASELSRLTGWRPTVSIQEMLRRTAACQLAYGPVAPPQELPMRTPIAQPEGLYGKHG